MTPHELQIFWWTPHGLHMNFRYSGRLHIDSWYFCWIPHWLHMEFTWVYLEFQMTWQLESTYSTWTPCGLQKLWDFMAVTPHGLQIKFMWSSSGVQVEVWLSVKRSIDLPAGGGSFNISHVTTVHALQTAYKLLDMNLSIIIIIIESEILYSFLWNMIWVQWQTANTDCYWSCDLPLVATSVIYKK